VTTLLTFGVGFMVRPATDQLIAMLQGKIIGITGTIELYQGKPEIKVMSILEQTSL
jgi:DNA/RNA endonuclease YhcR with UshA esterase domain